MEWTVCEDAPLVEFMYLVLTRTPGGVTEGDSGLCCRVPCLSSAIISLRLFILGMDSRDAQFPSRACLPSREPTTNLVRYLSLGHRFRLHFKSTIKSQAKLRWALSEAQNSLLNWLQPLIIAPQMTDKQQNFVHAREKCVFLSHRLTRLGGQLSSGIRHSYLKSTNHHVRGLIELRLSYLRTT